MRSIGLVSSFAALLVSAPLMAQGRNFRTDDVLRSTQYPQNGQRDARQSQARIPPGQMPPAGMCRIWIDGVPPGRQPAPTDCQTAVATKPANARVIWGDQSAFPGKGKGRFNSQNGNVGGVAANRGRGRGNDAENDNDDDDNGSVNSRRSGSTQWPVIGGVASPTSSRDWSAKPKKGKGHGRD